MIKTISKLGREGDFLTVIEKKKIYKNPPQKLVANIWAPKSLQTVLQP